MIAPMLRFEIPRGDVAATVERLRAKHRRAGRRCPLTAGPLPVRPLTQPTD